MVPPANKSVVAAQPDGAGDSGSRPDVVPPTPEEIQAARETVREGYRLSFILDPDGRVRQVTETRGLDAWPQDNLVGLTLADISRRQAGTERGDMWQVRIEHAIEADLPVEYLDPLPGGDHDAPRSVGSTVTPVRTADGELQAIVVEIEDLSVDEKSHRQLEESEARFRSLAESLPHMVLEADGAGNARYLSAKWMEFTGKPVGELLGRGYAGLIHPDDRDHMRAALDADRPKRAVSFRLLRQDGEYRWMEVYLEVTRDARGVPTRAIGTAIDVTDRRLAEDTARENHAQLRRALTITGLGRYSLSVMAPLLTIDERGAEIFGLDHELLCGPVGVREMRRIVHADDRPLLDQAMTAAKAGDSDLDIDVRIWRPSTSDPELRWIAVTGRLDRDGVGPPRVLGLLEDITDRRSAEDSRLRSQKREMIGTLVGGIAHDFNNVISAILSNATVARSEIASGATSETSLIEIERGAKRAAELVQRVLVQGRDDDTAHELLDLAGVVDEACALLRPGLPKGISLVQAREFPLPDVLGSATQIHQLVVNLVTNAAQSISDRGGTIDLSIGTFVPPMRSGSHRRPPGVQLVVRDDGPGIPASVLERVFDPYFTTKPPGEGTGLGLSAAQTIVRAHGGSIDVDSEPGTHTTFTVNFPGVALDLTQPLPRGELGGDVLEAGRTAHAAVPVGARVMFVDDESSLVRLAERALPATGFSPVGFVHPEAALEAFVAAPNSFDALVTDLSMPILDGLTLIERIRSHRPDLPVVLTSGFMTAENRGRARDLGVDAVVPKPCSIVDLAAAIRAIVS